ncbi:uncharacterized protein M437DRAFT_68638 [Aureobasidium melanogenum CBS 110374]|uniref:Uncharacterized protein n=1 Tax=Aureobasidium melanogenum (strain CBS 110374) TaxID=1043003 RepID=A0A074VGZ5_AURM1|nr:uncharacterized protein M437DRAFT_68638 [Aureobasidium melanogenum CBS 110374]KEQ60020.1 hypothetical protein M437DRAFT_68638 [Aureobasidium melanogenum CBS 110374]
MARHIRADDPIMLRSENQKNTQEIREGRRNPNHGMTRTSKGSTTDEKKQTRDDVHNELRCIHTQKDNDPADIDRLLFLTKRKSACAAKRTRKIDTHVQQKEATVPSSLIQKNDSCKDQGVEQAVDHFTVTCLDVPRIDKAHQPRNDQLRTKKKG